MIIKSAGPIALGGRELPPWFANVVALMAPALLAALVVTSALADGEHLAVGPDTAGVAAAGLSSGAAARSCSPSWSAAVVAGGLRALT